MEVIVPQWVEFCAEFDFSAHEYLKIIISELQSKLNSANNWSECPSQTTFKDHQQRQKGFPGNSASKESTCKSGDPSLIPGKVYFYNYLTFLSLRFHQVPMVQSAMPLSSQIRDLPLMLTVTERFYTTKFFCIIYSIFSSFYNNYVLCKNTDTNKTLTYNI